MPNLTRSRLQRYGFAVLAVAIALLLKLLLNPLLEVESPFLLFFATVMLSAWYGGMRAGVVAAFLSALSSDYFFLSPTYSFLKGSLGQNVRLGLFVLEGLSISWLIAQLHAAKQRAEVNQRRLQESEARVRRLVDSNLLGVISADLNGRITEANDAFLKMVGYTEDLLAGKVRWDAITPPEYQTADEHAIQELRTTGVSTAYEKEYIRQDGSRVPILIGSALFKGSQEQGVGFVLDLSDRQRVELALQQSEERYRSLVVATSQIVWTTDPEGQVVDMPSWRAYTGQSQEEVRGWGWLNALHPEDRDRTAHIWSEAVHTKSLYNTEYRVRGADGNYRYFSVRGVPVLAEDGSIREWVGTCTDISDRQQAEEQIRVHATRLQVLAQASRRFSEAILDFQAVLDEVSQRIAQLLGDACVIRLLSEDGQWLELVAVYHPNPEAIALIREILSASPQRIDEGLTSRVMQTGQPLLIPVVSQEELHASAKQEYLLYLDRFGVNSILIVPLRVRGRVIGTLHLSRDRPGHPYTVDDLVFLQDLADRAALAIDNARLYSQALEANRLKDDFLAIVSHELRTPINAVLGWATLLRTRKFNEDKKAQALEIIERNAKLQTQLIEDLLDISRLIRGKLRLNLRPLHIIPVLEAAIKAVLPTAESKAIQIVSVFDPTVGQVCADSNRLQQVISNLLSNAIKFTPVGGRVEVRLSVVSDRQQKTDNGQWTTHNYAQIEVSDTGKGISPDFLPYVFDRFRQAESAITRSNSGLGLGLAIVRQLVELHGGAVYADSPGIGQGATFTIKLPLWESVTREEILGQPILA